MRIENTITIDWNEYHKNTSRQLKKLARIKFETVWENMMETAEKEWGKKSRYEANQRVPSRGDASF